MIKFLEDLIADLLGARDPVAIPVRSDDKRPQDRQLKGRK